MLDPQTQMAAALSQPSPGNQALAYGFNPAEDQYLGATSPQARARENLLNNGVISPMRGIMPVNLPGRPDPMKALFAVPPATLQHMAGDVVPLPIQPGPMAGKPTPGEVSMAVRQSLQPGSNINRITANPVFQQRLEDRFKKHYGP